MAKVRVPRRSCRKRTGSSPRSTGFVQPTRPHEQWHTDIAYLNILGTQYFLLGVLDGYSRAILHAEIRRTMTTTDVEIVLERAVATLPAGTPRPLLITDNGSQYVSAQFTQYLRTTGLSHSRTRVGHQQSNGKFERWNKTAKEECFRRIALGGRDDPDALAEAQQVFGGYGDIPLQVRIEEVGDDVRFEGSL